MFRYIYPLIFIIFSGVLISSCKDSDEPLDTEAPVVIVKSQSENQKVAGTITIEATANDRSTELSMQVFLDGGLVYESEGGLISTQVDTKTLTEGIHNIKIVAMDKAGNISEKTFNVDVRNILFKVQISSNYVGENIQIYFGLSQNDGTPIALNKVENDGTITVPTPSGFNPDSSFVFTQYFYLNTSKIGNSPGTLFRTMSVYAGLNVGEFKVAEFPVSLPVKGTHHLEITEVPTNYLAASLQGNNMGSWAGHFGNSGEISLDLSLTNTMSDLYFWLNRSETEAPVYNHINSILLGESTHFSVTDLPQMEQGLITTNDIAAHYDYTIYNDGPGSQDIVFSGSGNFDNGKLPVYYPGSIYPKYVFELGYQLGDNSYTNRVKGETPPSSFQNLNAAVSNVNYANRKLKVTSTGKFDFVFVTGRTTTFTSDLYKSDGYTVCFPNGKKNQITIPTLPAELLSLEFKSPTEFVFENATIYDFLELSGASDYQSKIVFSADNVLLQYRDFIASNSRITPTSSGGRLSTHNKMTLPKSAEGILQNYFHLNEFGFFH